MQQNNDRATKNNSGGGGRNSGGKKGSNNRSKVSVAAAIQQARRDGYVDLETGDSVVGQVPNLRTLLNKATFQKLPPDYQYKLSRLMPQVDVKAGEEDGEDSDVIRSDFDTLYTSHLKLAT